MTKLNKKQLAQVKELETVTDKEFTDLMLKYTSFVTNEELEDTYNEAMELESEDYSLTHYDVDFSSVVSEYSMLENDTISEAFGYYGDRSLYMDEYGQGLIVSNYY